MPHEPPEEEAMTQHRAIHMVLQPTEGTPHESAYKHTDVDGDRLLIATALMPGDVPGIYFRTDPIGSSVPLRDLPALIAQLRVIAEASKAEAEATP